MKPRFTLFRRAGIFYCQDTETGKQQSLRTTIKAEALTLLHVKNEALRQPTINRQIARAYLTACDPLIATRTWQDVMEAIPKLKSGATRVRWETAIKAKALDPIRSLKVLETRGEHFLRVLESAGVSINSYLRRTHGFALDMDWVPWPVLPKKRWSVIRYKSRRGVTLEEHQKILAGEANPEWHAFYELLWYLGGSQTDIANLCAENIDWKHRIISYARRKTGSMSHIRFGDAVEQILRSRPQAGMLFPMLGLWKQADRGKAFIRRCRLVGVSGVSLHCYRYAWAERAKQAGYPERFAQEALGHNSKAVHRAYARNAQVTVPPLEEYEQESELKILPFPSLSARAGLIAPRPFPVRERNWFQLSAPALHPLRITPGTTLGAGIARPP